MKLQIFVKDLMKNYLYYLEESLNMIIEYWNKNSLL